MSSLLLSLLETRVLGVLVEKERTVPDSYPLTLNSLVSGCNQKNNRDPLLNASDEEVQVAIDSLKSRSLVIESSGSRVMRYAHNVGRVLRIPEQAVALLATLLLRGPQTTAELRINAERLHKFADISAVEGFLDELAARSDEAGGALAIKLSKLAGAREARWVHLLSGAPEDVAADGEQMSTSGSAVSVSEIAMLKAQISRLDQNCTELRELVERLYRELGVSRE
jgi:uncharacterized protein